MAENIYPSWRWCNSEAVVYKKCVCSEIYNMSKSANTTDSNRERHKDGTRFSPHHHKRLVFSLLGASGSFRRNFTGTVVLLLSPDQQGVNINYRQIKTKAVSAAATGTLGHIQCWTSCLSVEVGTCKELLLHKESVNCIVVYILACNKNVADSLR